MKQSLHGFCKQHNLPKTSVKRWLNDEGFDTSEGLSQEAIAAALVEFKPKGSAPNPHVLPPDYIDPFTGTHPSSAMVPSDYQATDRSLAVLMAEQRVKHLCQNAALNTQQTVQAVLDSGDQLGTQLGAFLGERTIQAAENQRRQMIEQYLQAQGVSTSPKPQAPPTDGNAA
jgi:hypothetical protein